jgi:hypothetical protein
MLIKSGSDIAVKDSDNEAEHIRTSTLTVKHATAANVGSYSCRDEHHDEERVVITVISSGKSALVVCSTPRQLVFSVNPVCI